MKKILVFIMVFALTALMLAGCAGAATTVKEDITLKVWGSQEDQAMLQTMIDSFKAANTDANYTITLTVVSEADAKAKVLEDPAAAADVFQFANDQITDLVKAGALYEVTRNKEAIIAANVAGSIEAATINGKLYAYPSTADNGYFLYYDKSVLSEEDVKSLDKMLEVAGAANKKIFMDVSNGWYIASFFLGGGGKLGVDANGVQTCDFNNENGLKVGEAIKAFTAHKAFLTGDDSVLTGGIGTTIAAGVSGTWNAEAISGKLGSNYAATKLPTFNLGGTQTQMSSFAGFKLVGVNAQTESAVAAMKLAEWLTNEQNQLLRFQLRQMGPSNIKAAANDAVKANIALAALSAQSAYAVSQNSVMGNYWSPAEAFGLAMEGKDYSKSIQTMLDNMVAQIVKPTS
ncbi:MAG TPA: maltose ABC transporter substrate-binding protein [Clostridiales bacterium]|nr:maltose ABC transporter substrate-binding protein [Clostridiales bacterium]